MACFSKSNGPNKKIVPSVISGDTIFCLIANNGEPFNSTKKNYLKLFKI